jgi:multiple sugar transport system substrate-binding protein
MRRDRAARAGASAAPPAPTTRRHLMTAGLAAASGLVAAACGVPSPDAAAVSGPLIYRTWWTPSTPPEKTWWEFVKPDFEAKHPGATLELEFIEFGQAYEKFVTSMAGGSLPDVMHGQTGYARDIWDLGALEDLSPFIAKTPSLAMSNFIPASLFYNQIGGKVYGIPHEGPDATILFYNAAHLESVGLDASPTAVDAWSWDDLVQATTKLTPQVG